MLDALLHELRTLLCRRSVWGERWYQRRCLQELDADRLRDLGLTPHDVRREAAKPVWRP